MSTDDEAPFRKVETRDAAGNLTSIRVELTDAGRARFGEAEGQRMLEALAGRLLLEIELLEDPGAWSDEARETARALDAIGGEVPDD